MCRWFVSSVYFQQSAVGIHELAKLRFDLPRWPLGVDGAVYELGMLNEFDEVVLT